MTAIGPQSCAIYRAAIASIDHDLCWNSAEFRDCPRPTALVVGPMKAGTSWLSDYLKTRSDVVLPQGVKETFYFDQRYELKKPHWYYSHFRPMVSGQPIIEVAPTYFHAIEAPIRIRRDLGKIRIAVTFRDPADRAFSLYQHMRRYGMTRCTTFQDAVNTHPSIVASSRFATCLRRWIARFGEDRVTAVFMEDLRDNPRSFASDCCSALGIQAPSLEDPLPGRTNTASSARSYSVAWLGRRSGDLLRSAKLYGVIERAKKLGLKRLFFGPPQEGKHRKQISSVDRRWFTALLADEIDELEQMVSRDLSGWRVEDARSPNMN